MSFVQHEFDKGEGRAGGVAIRHVKHVHVSADNAEPPLVQGSDDVASKDVFLEHIVRHGANAKCGKNCITGTGSSPK
jgi:hypothetical protein